MNFTEFPKIPRLSREVVITEKIDGTNASIMIEPYTPEHDDYYVSRPRAAGVDYGIAVGSRTRWITTTTDNAGFANWVKANGDELFGLGVGHHFGEWWGKGIQRNYAQTKKHFSLFNTHRWGEVRPACCLLVPVLYQGPFEEYGVMKGVKAALNALRDQGSAAAPGFMKPEGIVVYHTAGNLLFKKTLEKDDEWKGKNVQTST